MIPKGLHIFGYKRQLFLFGVDFNQVRAFSESLRLQRFPDAYKGKGIQYHMENLIFKEGKQK